MSDLHLDDETLSATIDGEAWPDHLAGCSQCLLRHRQLIDAAALIGAAVPAPAPGAEDASVLAAMTAAGHRQSPRSLPRVLAVAAAIVAVLALSTAPLLFRGGSSPDVASDALRSGRGTAEADLGSVDDATSLNARLRAALGLAAAADVGGGSGGTEVEPEGPSDAATASSPASEGQVATDHGGDVADTAAVPIDKCLADARRGFPAEAALAYAARLRWQGQPALVYVLVDSSKDTLSRRAVVTGQRDCSILVVQSF